ncbi:MAG: hypothetical protein JWR32_1405 [Mycobacterium sp.]|jgi:hypothetical protein|nr:hypothetical protein [Mycobacterium sp.]
MGLRHFGEVGHVNLDRQQRLVVLIHEVVKP